MSGTSRNAAASTVSRSASYGIWVIQTLVNPSSRARVKSRIQVSTGDVLSRPVTRLIRMAPTFRRGVAKAYAMASQPEPLLVAPVPHLGDLAVDDAVHVHAADLCLIATLGHRRVVDDGDVLTVVPRDDKMEVPVQLVEHRQNFLDALADLLAGHGMSPSRPHGEYGVGVQIARPIEVGIV